MVQLEGRPHLSGIREPSHTLYQKLSVSDRARSPVGRMKTIIILSIFDEHLGRGDLIIQ
jgi:hypothetical protein